MFNCSKTDSNMFSFEFILLTICLVQFSSSQDVFNHNSWTVQNGILNFGSKLNQILHQDNLKNRNILFSPMNIYTALLLLHLGSNGRTRDEITNILRIEEADEWPGVHEKFNSIFESIRDVGKEDQKECNVNITNVIFIYKVTLVKKFVGYVRAQYDSDIINVNFSNERFETVKFINKYIANKVGNHVPKLYTKRQTPYAKVILTSCLNFKSPWEFPFRKSTTQREAFLTTEDFITVNMMQRVGKMPYADIPTLGAEIGKLVTVNTNISLFVVLPYEIYSLRYFLDNVTPEDIKLMVSMVVDEQFVDFKMPQTVLKWRRNLNETLSRFGASEIFSRQANFTNMMKEKYFDVNEVKYAADLKIMENGIESSSVTSVKVSPSVVIESSSSDPFHELRNNQVMYFNDVIDEFSELRFYVNRPFFMFMYHHQIESVLFFAAVNDPNGG